MSALCSVIWIILLCILYTVPTAVRYNTIKIIFLFCFAFSSWNWSAAPYATYPRPSFWVAETRKTIHYRHRSNRSTESTTRFGYSSTRSNHRPNNYRATCHLRPPYTTGPNATYCQLAAYWESLVKALSYWPATASSYRNRAFCSVNTCR